LSEKEHGRSALPIPRASGARMWLAFDLHQYGLAPDAVGCTLKPGTGKMLIDFLMLFVLVSAQHPGRFRDGCNYNESGNRHDMAALKLGDTW
jgi:hypothetical protein